MSKFDKEAFLGVLSAYVQATGIPTPSKETLLSHLDRFSDILKEMQNSGNSSIILGANGLPDAELRFHSVPARDSQQVGFEFYPGSKTRAHEEPLANQIAEEFKIRTLSFLQGINDGAGC